MHCGITLLRAQSIMAEEKRRTAHKALKLFFPKRIINSSKPGATRVDRHDTEKLETAQ